jgi:HSP20 family molecular chaperone IbpA
MRAVTASIIDGVLTVCVPRVAPETTNVRVESAPLPDDLPEPRGQVSLALPGLGASDVSASITRDRQLLLSVKGSNSVCGSVHEVLRLPERAVPAEARASMVNGIFSFSVPIAAEEVVTIPVKEEAQKKAEEAPAEGTKTVLLLEAPVPGLSASDITAEARCRTVHVTSTTAAAHTKRPLRRSVLLPPHAAPHSVVATCVNGLLTVTAAIHKPAHTTVTVSATQKATLAVAAAPKEVVEAAPPVEPDVPEQVMEDAPAAGDDAVEAAAQQ